MAARHAAQQLPAFRVSPVGSGNLARPCRAYGLCYWLMH
jgi:hypothetical protein